MGAIEAIRPKVVDAAVTILALVVLVGFFRLFATVSFDTVGVSPAAFIALTLASMALVGFLIAMIASGRNWARMLYTTFFVYGVVKAIALSTILPRPPGDMAFSIAMHIVTLVAIVLLFMPAANAWFRQARALRLEHKNHMAPKGTLDVPSSGDS